VLPEYRVIAHLILNRLESGMQDSIKIHFKNLNLNLNLPATFPYVLLRKLIVDFLTAMFCLLSPFSNAAEATPQRDPNTDPNLAGCGICDGISSRKCQVSFDVGRTTYANIEFYQDDTTYYFAAIACDS
jgi:hypothetical protein